VLFKDIHKKKINKNKIKLKNINNLKKTLLLKKHHLAKKIFQYQIRFKIEMLNKSEDLQDQIFCLDNCLKILMNPPLMVAINNKKNNKNNNQISN